MVRSAGFARGRRAWVRAAVAALGLALLLATLPLASTAARAQEPDGPSAAGDHAEVIAQGVASFATGDLAWRLVEDSAEPVGEADFEERALGFAVATEGALLLTDDPTGARTRLAPGEAAFTAEGAVQARESLGDAATPYLRIGLVAAAEASNGNGDEVLFAGNGFAAPEGDREVELVGVKLEAGESTTVESGFESLVLVVDGEITVGDGEALGAGNVTAVVGAVELRAEDGAARVLVALIGAEVPAAAGAPEEDDATPIADEPEAEEPADETGQIVVLSALCPAGVTAEQAADTSQGDPCFGGEPVAGMVVTAVDEQGETYEAEVEANGSAVLPDLPVGAYQLSLQDPEGLGPTVGVCGGQDASSDLPVVEMAASSVELELPAGKEYLCDTRTVQAEGDGTVTLDADGDGLADEEELELGTDPANPDSDADRLSDGFEAGEFGTNPLAADTDEDGLGDGDELEVHGTDPLTADTDGDGVDDATELDAGTDPTDPASA